MDGADPIGRIAQRAKGTEQSALARGLKGE